MFLDFHPTHLVNLAALATMSANSIIDFHANTDGVQNIVNVLNRINPEVEAIYVSTQHVISPGNDHAELMNYSPYKLYGESKVIGESIVMRQETSTKWTIVRPTNIYGENHPNLKVGLWDLMIKGIYFHPRNDNSIKSYGYVKNTCWQILKIMVSENKEKFGKIYYLGDGNIPQEKWITGFEIELTGKRSNRLPKILFLATGCLGSLLGLIGFKSPISLQRYKNLKTSNPVPVEITLQKFGVPPFTLEEGIQRTAAWVKNEESGLSPK